MSLLKNLGVPRSDLFVRRETFNGERNVSKSQLGNFNVKESIPSVDKFSTKLSFSNRIRWIRIRARAKRGDCNHDPISLN